MEDAVRAGSLDAILWDLDGTLIDSEPLHEWAFVQTLKSLDLEVPPEFHERVIGHSERQCFVWLSEMVDMPLPYDEWVARRYSFYLDNVSRLLPIAPSLALWDEFARQGIAQAIVSNSDRRIVNANMRHLGFDPDTVPSVSRSEVSAGKPRPEPYLAGAERMGVAPARTAVVEDSATGIASGVAAGMVVFTVTDALVGKDGVRSLTALQPAHFAKAA